MTTLIALVAALIAVVAENTSVCPWVIAIACVLTIRRIRRFEAQVSASQITLHGSKRSAPILNWIASGSLLLLPFGQ